MSQDESAVNTPVVEQNTTTTESAPVETNSSEVVDDGFSDITVDDTKSPISSEKEDTESKEVPEAETPEGEQADETQSDEKPRGKEKREQQLKEEIDQHKQTLGIPENKDIRDLVAARNALAELNEARQREAQVANEQTLLNEVNPDTGDYFTPQEAERIARQQVLEEQQQSYGQHRYELEVQQNQQILSTEAHRVTQEFPIFDPQSIEFIPEIAQQVDELLEQNLIFDPETNQLVGSNVSPYQLYKTVATAYQKSQVLGQIKGQKATEKMMAATDSTSSAPVKEKEEDSFMKGFNSPY